MLIGMQDRQEQVIVKHLRVGLQGGKHLREVLHGLVVDELYEAGDLVEHARVELADDMERAAEFGAELIGGNADLLFGRDHREMRVGARVGEPLEVPFDHDAFKVAILAELRDHVGVGFVASLFQ